jgi:hypothetical protein
MTWLQVKFFLQDYWKGILVFLAGVVLMIFVIWYFWGGSDNKKEQEIQSNIDVHKGEANVIGNLITNQKEAVNNAAKNTNQAINALGNSINRPSNSFDGNSASDRFCRDFPSDPSCQ